MGNAANKLKVYDNLYGYIELSKEEYKLIQLPIFQRLQWIKQLGSTNTIFPSALHTRYLHSLGVFHIMKKMIKHLNKQHKMNGKGKLINARSEKALRYAALLHDIGHVPLSHAGEEVMKSVHDDRIRRQQEGSVLELQERLWQDLFPEKYRGDGVNLHELLSVEIVLHNTEIGKIISERTPKVSRESIARIIVGQHKRRLFNKLLHSELDADRLDFLLRDSNFTGLGYGHIDLDYIISRLVVPGDKEFPEYGSELCINYSGLHSIEHYILARFFYHMQVVL